MIILTEVAEKLSKILNGQDNEIGDAVNPTSFEYVVATSGFHLDKISDRQKNSNFIPVFISSMGGQFNPVKGLKQASYSIPVILYFPVRFKDSFYALADFLADVFVGSKLNYGDISGSAISNISVPQYGEIQDLDLKQFKSWVDANYQREIEVMEPFMTMQFSLYLSNAADGLLFGNDVTASFSFTYNSTKYTLDDVDFDGISLQSNSQTQSEQEEGTNEADSVPFGTAYGMSFKLYPNLNKKAKESTTENPIYFYKELLKIWLAGNIQEVRSEITFTFANDQTLQFKRDCFIQSIIAPVEKGQLFGMTISLSKVLKEEE